MLCPGSAPQSFSEGFPCTELKPHHARKPRPHNDPGEYLDEADKQGQQEGWYIPPLTESPSWTEVPLLGTKATAAKGIARVRWLFKQESKYRGKPRQVSI